MGCRNKPTKAWCRQTNVVLRNVYQNQEMEKLQSPVGITGIGNNKLRTYAKLKTLSNLEKYLTLNLTWLQKRTISRIRVGDHKLRVETGRHCRPRLPPDERLCLVCKTNVLEDEIHLITECIAYSRVREKYLTATSNTCQISHPM